MCEKQVFSPETWRELMKGSRIFLYTCVLFCLFVLVVGAFLDIVLRYYIFDREIKKVPFSLSYSSYPSFKSQIEPDLSAKAVVVMDNDSKTVLFSKNPNLLFSMASTTKIMTALAALDYYKMDDLLTVKTEDIEGVNVGFKIGEKLFFKDILYAMLLPSGNDAALVVAENYPGGEESFVKKMNEKAKLLELNSTNFADPIGLDDSKDYTTPIDLVRLASGALENKIFAEIVATKTKEISNIDGKKYTLNNLNRLLGVAGVNGIKTGYTTEAGQVLVTSKLEIDSEGKEHILIILVMGSEDRFWDTSKILSSVSDNVNFLPIQP